VIAAAMGAEGDLAATRLARGSRCFAVWLDESLGGYGWLSTGPEWIGELQLEIKPRDREGYVWNCVTLREHRRRGVFRSLVTGISLVARGLGAKRMWIGSVAIPAERALAPIGFEPALRFHSATFAGLHMMRVTPAANSGLATDASSVLRVRPGFVIRGSHPRRH
jgi:GNAT superfamily N-acetyltransferase